jgi:leucyl aminopeptidase
MKVTLKRASALTQKSPCLIVGVVQGKTATARLKEIDAALGGALGNAVRGKEFAGKSGETLLLHAGKRLAAQRVLLVGLGAERDLKVETLRRAAGNAVAALQSRRIGAGVVDLASLSRPGLELPAIAGAVAEGARLAAYRFDAFRGESGKDLAPLLADLLLVAENGKGLAAAQAAVAQAGIVCAAVHLARDLVNLPGNAKAPLELAARAKQVAKEQGLAYTVLNRKELEQQGCGALLGVAQGSMREPCMVILEHRGGGAEKPIVLVGKGVVFDAGGISLKPAEKMDEMKMDMAGAAAVLATLQAAAALQLPLNLVGILPIVENLPSGSAYRPGDILTSLSGKTIEILNTDAEGRLILADALTYAKRFEPQLVVDLATLTGACIIALGSQASAVLGNNEALVRQLLKAGESSGERLWQLPLWDEYAELIKSEVADVKNSGGRPAGTITAAAFLQKFASDFAWAHLDIAGTAWEEKGRPCVPRGATGVGVRLLLDFLRRRCLHGKG